MARDRALALETCVVDTRRDARTLLLSPGASAAAAVEALLDRVALLARSRHAVRDHAFALFLGARAEALVVAVSEPVPEGLLSSLADALAEVGPAAAGPSEPLATSGLAPLLGLERGVVSFFHSLATRPFRALAGRRAVRIVLATPSHAPDPDVEVDGVPATQVFR
jgi:hypothetical protein